MIFNSSFVIGLTLSSALYHSPLFINPPNQFSSSINFQGLNFKKFIFHALYFDSPISNIVIHKSNFENFLGRPISIQQIDCMSFHNQIITNQYNAPCVTVTYCNFQRMLDKPTGSAICILYDSEATSLFDHCKFSFCLASEDGGALYCHINNQISNFGNIIVTSSQFEYCSVNNNSNVNSACGGAIYCCSRTLNLANTTFSFCGITSNAARCCGGAVYANINDAKNTFSYDTFHKCYVNGTSESFGGAIYLLAASENQHVDVIACNFTTCEAKNGSAIYSEREIDLLLEATRFISFNATTVIYLDKKSKENTVFVKSIGMSNIQANYYFLYINGSPRIINYDVNSGLLYLDIDGINGIDSYTKNFSNKFDSFLMLNVDKYSKMPVSTYFEQIVVEPTTEPAFQQMSQTGTDGSDDAQQTESNTEVINPPVIDPITSVTENAAIDGAAGETKSGLSTVAIVFIVIACIIFVIGLIIAAVLLLRSKDGCYRNRCTGSGNLGKSTSYF